MDSQQEPPKKKLKSTQESKTQSDQNKTYVKFDVTDKNELLKKDAPFLATFPNGVNIPGDTQLFHFEKKTSPTSQFIYGETNSIRYFSRQTFDEEDDKKKIIRYALGIFNPKSKHVRIMPLDKIFRMKQKFHETEAKEKTSSAATNNYTNEFASDKLKRLTKTNEKYNLTKMSQLERTVGIMKSGPRSFYPEYLPEPNRKAKQIEDVFPIPSLLNDNMFEFMQSCRIVPVLEKLSKGYELSVEEMKLLPKVIKELIESDPDIFKNDIDLDICRTALYLIYLFWFAKSPHRFSIREYLDGVQKKSKDNITSICPPKKVALYFLDTFSTKDQGYASRSKENVEKLLAHIIIVYSHLRNYTIRIDCLVEDLGGISEQNIEKVAKVLGFIHDTQTQWRLKMKKYAPSIKNK
jgi:hypothetical protein